MPNNELIKFCRYYHGGDKNPYEGKDQNKAMFWDIERYWLIESMKRSPNFSEALTMYLNCGLNDFSFDDGVPLTLKAEFFYRYAKTAYSLSDAVEPFKELYQREYRLK